METILELFQLNNDFINNKDNYSECFKLPIEYLDKTKIKNIDENVINDLELKFYKNNYISQQDNSNNQESSGNLYYKVFNPTNCFDKSITNRWNNYYTTDKTFLINTQELIKNYKCTITFDTEKKDDNKYNNDNKFYEDNILDNCEEIIYDSGFVDKYQYIDLPFLRKYNNNSLCLLLLSLHNLSSPVISLIVPILFMFLPFIIIKIQGLNVTLENYILYLKQVFQQHIIGKFFQNFQEANFSTKIYLIVSLGFFIFQTYLNIISCKRFFENIEFIHNKLFLLKDYIKSSITKFKNLLSYTRNLKTYLDFNTTIESNCNILNSYLGELSSISNYRITLDKLFELGIIMKTFYRLNNDQDLIKSLYYSFGLNGYIKNIKNIQKLVKNNLINYCNFIDDTDKKSTTIKNSYFASLIDYKKDNLNIVKNSYTLNKNIIITGPNASGKTTLLKSCLFNIILSQQIGCGFYNSADIKLYDFIHCYINIPDTSGRDSLYQAEARQCKTILNTIEKNKDKNHLCVFDELYSGTNPDEAVASGISYLKYLNNFDNVNFILTTHYTKLCKSIQDKTTKNYHMDTVATDNDFDFTYKIKKGISKTKGGIKVLKDLNYPKNIIENIRQNQK
tara:strand:+ start:1027 stop:2886 length:1860 start_codon:yes stop_codon:yes gene_type:complete